MTRLEKLQTIADNQQKIYDAGYETGFSEGNSIYYAKNLNGIWHGSHMSFPHPVDLIIRLYKQPTGDNNNAF